MIVMVRVRAFAVGELSDELELTAYAIMREKSNE